MYFVYIARCSDGTFYVGYTEDIETRENVHNQARGARYTAMRRPVRIVYTEAFESLEAAVRSTLRLSTGGRERQLKRWSRAKKDALISGDLQTLKRISQRRSKALHPRSLGLRATW